MTKIKYFAYGSNMLTSRLKARVPSAEPVAVASLEGHTLRFHKSSTDGSGKGDAYETGNPDDLVWGVVFELDEVEKGLLDRVEGLGYGYEEKTVELEMRNGERMEAVTYYATNIDEELLPYEWYKDLVLYGAKEHGLPEHHIEYIESIESKKDLKESRREENRSLLPS